MAGMDLALFIYITLCIAIGLMVIEAITCKGLRWSIADLLKVTLLVSVMLALGRILASV
jgi:hypothetical protein